VSSLLFQLFAVEEPPVETSHKKWQENLAVAEQAGTDDHAIKVSFFYYCCEGVEFNEDADSANLSF